MKSNEFKCPNCKGSYFKVTKDGVLTCHRIFNEYWQGIKMTSYGCGWKGSLNEVKTP